jgi:uncharacterized membrane protein
MEYTTEITIDLPRDRVVALFDDPDNLAKWQPGLQSMETIEGEPGTPGAKTRLVYEARGRRVEMIETIIDRDLPRVFSATYEAKNVWNEVVNRFHEAGPRKTRWVTENEFKFSGAMALLAFFMRGAFRKQTLEDMERFKAFAEDIASET